MQVENLAEAIADRGSAARGVIVDEIEKSRIGQAKRDLRSRLRRPREE